MASLFPTNVADILAINSIQIFYGVKCGPGSGYLSTCTAADAIGIPVSDPPPTAISTVAVFTDTAMPCFAGGPGSPDPINKSELDDLTCQFATDFLSWLEIQFDYSFIGTVNVEPNGYIDEIEFDFTGNSGKIDPSVTTRIKSMPWNGWPRELGHDDPSCPEFIGPSLAFGIATETIPANGSGHVQLYQSDRMTTMGDPVLVDNSHGWWNTDFAGGTKLIIGRIGCSLVVVSASC